MEGIIAVAFLVGCASNLLICEDLPAQPDRFADMAACTAALPALIRREGQDSNLPVVMGKCRLMLRPSMPPQTAAVFAATSR